MKLPPFEYRCPTSLHEALAILAENSSARPLAGGQTLIPILAFRLADPAILVDLRRIPDLDRIEIDGETIRLGAMVRWRDIEEHAGLRETCPILPAAIRHVAHYQIRNRGTVGGSLAHGDPATEMPAMAVLCDAVIHVAGHAGSRQIAARDFFTAPLTTALAADELITQIDIPCWPAGRSWGFEEFAIRRGDYALAGIGTFYDRDASGRVSNPHIAVLGATEVPRRLEAAEAAMVGSMLDDDSILAAAAAAATEVEPPEDIHASQSYRRALVATLVERALRQAKASFVTGS